MKKLIKIETYFYVDESVTAKQVAGVINRNGHALADSVPVTSKVQFSGCVYSEDAERYPAEASV